MGAMPGPSPARLTVAYDGSDAAAGAIRAAARSPSARDDAVASRARAAVVHAAHADDADYVSGSRAAARSRAPGSARRPRRSARPAVRADDAASSVT